MSYGYRTRQSPGGALPLTRAGMWSSGTEVGVQMFSNPTSHPGRPGLGSGEPPGAASVWLRTR